MTLLVFTGLVIGEGGGDEMQRAKGIVTEFIPLHDILYIFLSPDSQPYLSINKFLTSLDWYQNLSTFIPDTSFP